MKIDDTTSGGYVRRWALVAGFPACVEDALPQDDSGALAAYQRNAAVRTLIDLVEPYEAAQVIVVRGMPDNGEPKTISDPAWVDPEDGSMPPMIENPAWSLLPLTVPAPTEDDPDAIAPAPEWAAYHAADDLIADASPLTAQHALWRTPEPPAGDPERPAWVAAATAVTEALNAMAAEPLAEDPRPVPEIISERQFMQQLATAGEITWDECFAYLGTGTIPSAFATAMAALPDAQRNPAKAAFIGANEFERHNPLTIMLGQIMGRDAAWMDDLWRSAALLR